MEDVNKQRLTFIFLSVLGYGPQSILSVYSSCTSPYISYAIDEKVLFVTVNTFCPCCTDHFLSVSS